MNNGYWAVHLVLIGVLALFVLHTAPTRRVRLPAYVTPHRIRRAVLFLDPSEGEEAGGLVGVDRLDVQVKPVECGYMVSARLKRAIERRGLTAGGEEGCL